MKEQKIIVDIDPQGRISAEAEGFSGDACLKDLERILEGLGGTATVERKPEAGTAQVRTQRVQNVGKKP